MTICEVRRLGRLPYQEAWDLQKRLAAARARQDVPDMLLLLEHPHTYTLGSSGKREHLLMSEAEQQRRGVTVLDVDRGGDITYHGPGQLVGYPIVQRPSPPNPVAFIRQLETVLIDALKTLNLPAHRLYGYTGVWVTLEDVPHKIAAIGVKVNTAGITQHGFALNVNTDLTYFAGIIPCGIPDKPVTSLAQIWGQEQALETVMERVIAAFGEVGGYIMREGEAGAHR